MRILERDAFTAQPVKRRRIGFGDAVGAQAVDDEDQMQRGRLRIHTARKQGQYKPVHQPFDQMAHVFSR